MADAFLVPAETDSGTAVFLVAADDPGVSVTAMQTTGLGSVGHLALDGAEVDGARMVGGAEVVVWLDTLATLGRSAFQLGVLERGLQLTAEYARTVSNSTARSAASRRWRSDWPTATSTSRGCG